jgi:hypothetical protein
MANNQNRKPDKDFNSITQAGLKAYNLVRQHSAVEPRLRAGTLDALSDHLARLGALVPGAKQAQTTAQAATQAQDQALTDGYAKVTAIRQAVYRHTTDPELRKAYGVGVRADPRLVKDVKAAIQQIIARADANVAEAASLAILPADITELKVDLAAIGSADDNQELERASAPLTTRERNQIANAIVDAVGRIASAGALHFAKQPAERETFEALLGAGNPKK